MTHPREYISIEEALRDLRSESDFNPETLERAFDAMLDSWTRIDIAAFLVEVNTYPVTRTLLLAGARALRRRMVPVTHSLPLTMDTCGTGGDGQNLINISTGAAIVLAAAGISVAKHGGRAASGGAGSADVLEALGIRTNIPPGKQARILQETGICFLYAPRHHPVLQRVAEVRKSLKVRTVFNLLGPLVNPAAVTHQLIGVPRPELCMPMAEAIQELGIREAWVVCGSEGVDEISTAGPTYVVRVCAQGIKNFTIRPLELNELNVPLHQLRGGMAEGNARIIRDILDGKFHPARAAIVLNAAAALCVVHPELMLKDAYAEMDTVVHNRMGIDVLDRWKAACERAVAPA